MVRAFAASSSSWSLVWFQSFPTGLFRALLLQQRVYCNEKADKVHFFGRHSYGFDLVNVVIR